jgi:hypothetical protein
MDSGVESTTMHFVPSMREKIGLKASVAMH